jgi:hypothetical protein
VLASGTSAHPKNAWDLIEIRTTILSLYSHFLNGEQDIFLRKETQGSRTKVGRNGL